MRIDIGFSGLVWDLKTRWQKQPLFSLYPPLPASHKQLQSRRWTCKTVRTAPSNSHLEKSQEKSVESFFVLQIHWNDSYLSRCFWIRILIEMLDISLTSLPGWKTKMDQKEGEKPMKITRDTEIEGELYDHIHTWCVIMLPKTMSQLMVSSWSIMLNKTSTRLSCRRDQKCGACVPTASVFQRKVTGHCIFMCLPHIATWPGLFCFFLDDRDSDIGVHISILKLKTCAQQGIHFHPADGDHVQWSKQG